MYKCISSTSVDPNLPGCRLANLQRIPSASNHHKGNVDISWKFGNSGSKPRPSRFWALEKEPSKWWLFRPCQTSYNLTTVDVVVFRCELNMRAWSICSRPLDSEANCSASATTHSTRQHFWLKEQALHDMRAVLNWGSGIDAPNHMDTPKWCLPRAPDFEQPANIEFLFWIKKPWSALGI